MYSVISMSMLLFSISSALLKYESYPKLGFCFSVYLQLTFYACYAGVKVVLAHGILFFYLLKVNSFYKLNVQI